MAEFKPNFLNSSTPDKDSSTPTFDGRPTPPAVTSEEPGLRQNFRIPDGQGGVQTLDLNANQAALDKLALESEVRIPNPEDLPLTLGELEEKQAEERAKIKAEVLAEMQAQFREQLKPRNLVELARKSAVEKLKSFASGVREGYRAKRDRASESLSSGVEQSKRTLRSLWSGLLKKSSQAFKQGAEATAGVAAVGVGAGVAAGKFAQAQAQATRERVNQTGEKISQKAQESYQAVSERVREVSWNLANKKFEIIGGLEHGVRRYVRLEADLQTLSDSIQDVKANVRMADQELLDIREDEISDAKQAGEIAFIQSRKAEYLKELSTRLQEQEELERQVAALDLQGRVDRAKDLYDKIEQNNPGYLKGEGQDSKLVRVMQEAMSLIGKVNAAEMDAALEDVATSEPVVSAREMEAFGFQGLDGRPADVTPSTPAPEIAPDEVLPPLEKPVDYQTQADDIDTPWSEITEPEDSAANEASEDTSMAFEPEISRDSLLETLEPEVETVSPPTGELLVANEMYSFAKHGYDLQAGDLLTLRYSGERAAEPLQVLFDEFGKVMVKPRPFEYTTQDKQVKENGTWSTKRYVYLRQSDTAPLVTLQFALQPDGSQRPETIHVESRSETEVYLEVDAPQNSAEVSANVEARTLRAEEGRVALERGAVFTPELSDGDVLKISHPTIPALQLQTLARGRLDTTDIDKDYVGEYTSNNGQRVATYRVAPAQNGPVLTLELLDGRLASLAVDAREGNPDGWQISVR